MNKLITLCLLLFSFILCGQERITEFDRKSKIPKSFTTTIEDNHFITRVSNNNKIEVFEIINDASIKRHSIVIDGAFDSAIKAGEPGFLLLKNGRGGVVYNILDNIFFELELDDGFCEIEWESNKYYEILILQSGPYGSFLNKYEIVNLNSGERTHIDTDRRVRDISENAILSNANGLYYVENRNTSALDSFDVDYILNASFHYSDDVFLFVSDNDFYMFDAISRVKTLIHSNTTSGSQSGIAGDKNVILFKERPYEQGFKLDLVFLDEAYDIINILNFNSLDNQEVHRYNDLSYKYEIINNKFIFAFRSKLYVRSILDGSYKSFNCGPIDSRSLTKIDDNNILCRRENDLVKINLQTLQNKVIAEDLILPPYKVKSLLVDDQLLVLGNEDVYAIDKNDYTLDIKSYFPKFSDGMHGYSELFKAGEDVILAEEGIYWITENGPIQISTNKVEWCENSFIVKYGAFYWFESDGTNHECFKFKNGEVSKIASSNNLFSSGISQLEYYFIIEDEVFYKKEDEKAIYKCTDDHVGKFISTHGGGSYPRFYNTDKHLIFDNKAIDKNGDVHIIEDEYPIQGYFTQQFKNNVFVNRPEGIRKMGIGGAEFIHEGAGSRMFALDQSLIIIYENNILVYEEDFVDTIPIPDNYSTLEISDNFFTFLSTDDTGDQSYYGYSDLTRSIMKFDMLDTDERIINVFPHLGNYLIFTTGKDTHQGANLNIYHTNQDGYQWESIIDFPIYVDSYNVIFETIGEKGLLIADDYICLIHESLEIDRFQNINGKHFYQRIIHAGDNVYFVGDGEEYGRQVYRYSEDITISNNRINPNLIKIFPNPSSSFLNVDIDYNSFTKYQIFGRQGMKIKSGKVGSDEPIDIRDLSTGYYLLRLFGKSNVVTKIFIKTD